MGEFGEVAGFEVGAIGVEFVCLSCAGVGDGDRVLFGDVVGQQVQTMHKI